LPPRKLNPVIDRDLEAITLKCLEKNPAKRYQSAGELADDLERFQQGKPVSATHPTRWQRLKKWAWREPVKAGLAACVLVLLFVLLVGGTVSNTLLGVALQQAKDAAEEADQKRAEANKHAADAKRLAREADEGKKKANDLAGIQTKLALVAANERQRADDLANILSRRVLRKLQKENDPFNDLDNLVKHAALSEELLRRKPLDEVKLDLADTYENLYHLHLQRQEIKEAAAALEKCILLQEQLKDKYPLLLLEVALNSIDLGTAYGRLGIPEKEMASDKRALKVLQDLRARGLNNPPSWRPWARPTSSLAWTIAGSRAIPKKPSNTTRKRFASLRS